MATQNVNRKTHEEDKELVITRDFNASRERVWQAWTDPKQVVQWWGPNGFTTTIEKMDVRTGGVWQHIMKGPDGTEYPNKSTFKEVVEHERIVYSHEGSKKGSKNISFESTWTFEALAGNKTRVTISMVFPSQADRDHVIKEYKADEGGKQTLARFEEHVEKSASLSPHTFTISRIFAAPRNIVWKAWTVPELMAKWWGPKGFSIGKYTLDFRPNGTYHYSMVAPDGSVMWGKFVYQEIIEQEKIVFMNHFSDAQGNITRHPLSPTWPLQTLSTVTFNADKNKTTVTVQWVPANPTTEELNTFVSGMAGMQQGWTGTFDQLEAFLTSGAK